MKIAAKPPVKVTFNWKLIIKSFLLFAISLILWIALLVAAVHVLAYYIWVLVTKGWSDPETMKFAIYLVIGTYFFLILDKKKVYEAFNIKRDLPYITIEQIRTKK